ncbi:MAG: hypothetical protein KAT05_06325 [Spirochaetes bacterium]|nr:hypothetical protein [Spirochaetota bacterium]
MNHYRLLDADFVINLIRTLSLIKDYDEPINDRIKQICEKCNYSLVSTNYVKTEINNKINSKARNNHDLFFESKQKDALKIKKEIFNVIRFVDLRKNPIMSIFQSTSLKNLGEKSLVVLLSSKYATQINSGQGAVKIVSNNSKDVISYLNKIKAVNQQLSDLVPSSILIQNYEFYYELFDDLKFKKSFRFYYYFVSNIDARIFDKKRIERLIFKEI